MISLSTFLLAVVAVSYIAALFLASDHFTGMQKQYVSDPFLSGIASIGKLDEVTFRPVDFAILFAMLTSSTGRKLVAVVYLYGVIVTMYRIPSVHCIVNHPDVFRCMRCAYPATRAALYESIAMFYPSLRIKSTECIDRECKEMMACLP